MTNRLQSLASALAVALAAPAVALTAQEVVRGPFSKGDRVVSIGAMTGGDYDGTGVGVQAEWGVLSLGSKVQLGLGGFVGVQRNSEETRTLKVSTTLVPIMAIANLHFSQAEQPKLDFYGGVSAGFARASSKASGATSESTSTFDSALGVQVGARYWLASRLGVVGQVGVGDLPLIFAGVSLWF